jgi:tight adherence protein B
MSSILISIVVFLGVAALVGALSLIFREDSGGKVEDRLNMLTGSGPSAKETPGASVIASPLDAAPNVFENLFERYGNISRLFQQADTNMSPQKFFAVSGGLGMLGAAACFTAGLNWSIAPLLFVFGAVVPLLWLVWRRKRRMKKFGSQLPDALELLSRALRAGHSLASGFDLVHQEMLPPISVEFGRVFEENNLGIPLQEAMENMTERVPNLDLKFFATAVILQRQTGGDLAEILDKIGALIRDRFRIWGQIQALTGEGRLSGIVLLAMPPALFAAVYKLNPEYVMLLFTDPLGKKMLIGTVVLQLMGAWMIRKIVNIKV